MDKNVWQLILEDRSRGYSIMQLSAKYNINRVTLARWFDRNGISRKKRTLKIVKKVQDYNPLQLGMFVGLWAGDGCRFIDREAFTVKIDMHKQNTWEFIFIQHILNNIFKTSSRLVKDKDSNKGTAVLYSKFIYQFFDEYLQYEKPKDLNVGLKEEVLFYSKAFIEGFLFGAILSDGHFQLDCVFSSSSLNFALEIFDCLVVLGYNPRMSSLIKNRPHTNYHVNLRREESRKLKKRFDQSLSEVGFRASFDQVKGYTP
ncbi:MAG: hypothetical protein Q7R96_04135 [Nanoarchaeota archaeon]|nr:hypothetical protein [Nanoarchaeota archaeon]